MRLDDWLLDAGLGPRRDVVAGCKSGRATVDGARPRSPAQEVPVGAQVAWDGVPVARLPALLAWHKPVGVLSTLEDPWGREGLDDVAPPTPWGAVAWHPVGRLDRDTSGLLLFSRRGALTQWLLHPRRAVPRTYIARVTPPPASSLVERLALGVDTAEGRVAASPVTVDGDRVTLTVREGKYRMVRRMLANAGHPVEALHRVSYGAVALGDLPERAWRAVHDAELSATGWDAFGV
jgi:23S rRNA pseudouridine2605 synthase